MRWFLTGLSALGLAALYCAGAPSSDALAAQAPAAPELPPAPYKPLPEGTQVDYDTWSFRVVKSDGFDITFKIDGNRWTHHYAVFGRTGDKAYTLEEDISEFGEEWNATLNGEARSALKGLWPLQPGRTIRFDGTEERRGYKGELEGRDWTVSLEVAGTAVLELDGKRYATFVVREHGVTEGRQHSFGVAEPLEYVTTLWYHPGSGLVLKALHEWIEGPSQGEIDRYKLLRVRFPAGTTNLALKGTPVGTTSAPSVAAATPAEPIKKLTKDRAPTRVVVAPTKRAPDPAPGFLGRDRIEEILVGNTMTVKSKKRGQAFLYFDPCLSGYHPHPLYVVCTHFPE